MTSSLKDQEIREFADDGITLWGYKKPTVSKGPIEVFTVWREGEVNKIIHLVRITSSDKNIPPFTYHSDKQKVKEAKREAVTAFRSRSANLEEYPSFMENIVSWLSTESPTITVNDAQSAGFCMLGVQQFFAKYNWGQEISATDILKYLNENNDDFAEPQMGAVVYAKWKKVQTQ